MNKNSGRPLVSVVIATYNGERFLREQLDSIIAQTYKPIEIVAVDDCSTDNTVAILNEYANQSGNFRVIRNPQNLGYQKNFEKGFTLAEGDYIAPCDQDDIWLPGKIEVLVDNIGNHPIAYCNSAFIDSNGRLMGGRMSDIKTLTDFDDPLMYVVGASAPGHAMLIKKQVAMAAMPFPELLSHDNWLGFVATFFGCVKFVDEVLVHYRRHDSNVFGYVDKKRKKKETSRQRIEQARQRLQLLFDKCPDALWQKTVLGKIRKSYESYSLANNFARMGLFFKYRGKILAYKRHNALRRCLYSLKVFFRII